MNRTFQSRLSAVQNRLNQKLNDNNISLAGDIRDCIIIRNQLNELGDIQSRIIDSIDTIEMMIDGLKDIPMKAFSLDNPMPSPSANDSASKDKQPIIAYAPIKYIVNQDDLIVLFFENPAGQGKDGSQQPWVLVLQVKEALGTFGSRTIQWQKLQLSYYDNVLHSTIKQYVLDMAERRAILGW